MNTGTKYEAKYLEQKKKKKRRKQEKSVKRYGGWGDGIQI